MMLIVEFVFVLYNREYYQFGSKLTTTNLHNNIDLIELAKLKLTALKFDITTNKIRPLDIIIAGLVMVFMLLEK